MTASAYGSAPPAWRPTDSPSSSAAPANDAASASVFDDLLDGEPLDSLLRDEAADWGDDAALANALLGDFGAASAGVVAHAPPPLADEPLLLHPCLDSTHSRPCAMCCPAPAEGEEGDYELVGENGKKNGEKRLRALLAKTRQWNSKAERDRLAALMEQRAAAAPAGSAAAASLARLASALRAKRSAMLAKSHLLTCARAWGYASDVWFRHGRATRARLEREALAAQPAADEDAAPAAEDGAADAAEPPSATELRLSGGGFPWREGLNLRRMTADEARAEVERQLKPLALAAAALIAGPDARQATEQLGADYFTAADLEEVRFAAQRTGEFASVWDSLRTDAAAAAARAGSAEYAAVPAWRRLAGRQTALEATLQTFGASLRKAAVGNCPHGWFAAPELIEQLRSGALQQLPLIEPDEHEVSPAAAASSHGPHAEAAARWLNEMFRGLCLVVELALRLQMLVADAKFADYSVFCEVTCFVIDTMAVFTAASSAAFAQRAAWMEAALAAAARASPSVDDPASPQASSDGSAAANAPAKPRMLLFRMSSGCDSGCGAGDLAADVASNHFD